MFVWGYNGYCRLGLGNQQDALVPKIVPQFAGPNELSKAVHVNAGPSNSVVIDKQGMYWIAGKWKNTGDGAWIMQLCVKLHTDSCPGVRVWRTALLYIQVYSRNAVCTLCCFRLFAT